MMTARLGRMVHAMIVAGLAGCAGAGLVACAGSPRVAFKADAAPAATVSAIEGDWTPQRDGSRVREMSIEREGSGWQVEVARVNDAGARVESEFPARLFSIGERTILEVEIARGRTGGSMSGSGESAAAFLYSDIAIEGDVLRTRALDAAWLRAYTQTHPALKIAAVTPWGDGSRALGVGRAEGLSAMLQAAAADPSAWGETTVWARASDDGARSEKD